MAPQSTSPAGPEPAGPAIEREQLDELRDLDADGDLFAGIIRSFLAEAPASLDMLAAAVVRADAEAIASVAHTLKGMAAALGANRVAAQSEALVRQARAGDLGPAPGTLVTLRSEFGRARAELDRILADAG